jgi:hypothetical protein
LEVLDERPLVGPTGPSGESEIVPEVEQHDLAAVTAQLEMLAVLVSPSMSGACLPTARSRMENSTLLACVPTVPPAVVSLIQTIILVPQGEETDLASQTDFFIHNFFKDQSFGDLGSLFGFAKGIKGEMSLECFASPGIAWREWSEVASEASSFVPPAFGSPRGKEKYKISKTFLCP